MSSGSIYYFDAGNTRLKLWACSGDKLVAESCLSHGGDMADVLAGLPVAFAARPDAVVGASVLSPSQELQFSEACEVVWARVPRFAYSRLEQCGVRNAYGEGASSLGIDRWLVMLGYDRQLLGHDDVVCIADCGTAVTIDLLCGSGRHLGGYIVPGIRLMQQALFSHTARVRHDYMELGGVSPGLNTAEAVTHGAMLALAACLEKAATQYDASLVLTGGDAPRIREVLGVASSEDPYLLLKGLQRYFADAGIS